MTPAARLLRFRLGENLFDFRPALTGHNFKQPLADPLLTGGVNGHLLATETHLLNDAFRIQQKCEIAGS